MGNVYASSDWHGNKELADQVFDFLQPDDTLYFLGDSIDRGPDGIYIFDKLYNDPRVKMLIGNHENMMAQCIPYLLKKRNRQFTMNWTELNEGEVTWNSLKNKDEKLILEYVNKIKKLPAEEFFINTNKDIIIMEHAGYTPGTLYRLHDPLWDRDHFYDPWPKQDASGQYGDMLPKVYMIHGHTPINAVKFFYGYAGNKPLTKEEIKNKNKIKKPTILNYCDKHKFDIDMETYNTGRVALLNLNTFKEIYFDIKGE